MCKVRENYTSNLTFAPLSVSMNPSDMKTLLKLLVWYPLAIATLIFTIETYHTYSLTKGAPGLIRQELSTLQKNPITFASLPRAAFEIKTALATQDARPLVIEKYFNHYNSPMRGLGEYIVKVGDDYSVNPYLVVAIAQQESNLGKLMPPDCHNAWGWGIHSEGTLCFDTWKEGISTYVQGIAEGYHAYNLYTPDEIMTKYVPHSPGGAWAKGVNQFLEDLETGSW